MQSLTGKITGDSLTAVEWNQLPQEVQNVITGLGITLSSGDTNQLGKAVAGYVANGDFYIDSGAADAYVLGKVGAKQVAPAYADGFSAMFRAGNTNTGASTVNVGGLGVKDIKTAAGADPGAGVITTGEYVSLRYSLANDWFEITTVVVADASTTVKGIVELLTNAELAAGTDTTRAATAAAIAALFGTSLQASNGYARLPIKIGGAIDEIIIQWGQHTNSPTPGVGTLVSLPVAYPTAQFITVMGNSSTTTSGTTFVSTTMTLIDFLSISNSPNLVSRWISIGH